MTTVDNRIVEMQFDNKQFESGVSTTLGSLKKLKESLNFKDSTKSLDNLESKSKKINFSSLASSVENIASRFTTLGIIGVTALQNITNSAVEAGKRITSALTIEPVKLGFEEYETQINAVQTILANTSSKGTTLAQVNNALDELNKYADMTIYNFTEMTRNIGTFTAAGVDLDTSTAAIKGIANLAAVSGSTSQQASTAMYQLSQALAAGTVKLQDWNSVVNAGMGGKVFQDALIETARVHGVAIDEMIESEGSFRETLSKGWLTSEVLTETLSKFTGDLTKEQILSMGYTEQQAEAILKMGETANDAATKVKTFTQLGDTLMEAMQSGWTQSWEYIIGDFEEAKESLTTLSQMFEGMINDSADSRNAILKEWHDLGGREDLWAGIIAGIEAVLSYVKPLQEGFKEIIPPITGQRLVEITKGFRNFMENAKISSEGAERFKNIAKSLATVIKNVFNALGTASGSLGKVWDGLKSVANGFLTIVESGLNFVAALTSGQAMGNAFASTINLIGSGLNLFGSLLSGVGTALGFFASSLGNVASSAATVVANLTGGTSSAISGFFSILQTIVQNIPALVGTAIRAIGDLIRNVLTGLPIHEINSAIQDTLLTLILANVNGFFKNLKNMVGEASETTSILTKIGDSISEVFETLTGAIKTLTTSVKVNMLLKIAAALGILAAALWVLAGIPIDQLAISLGALAAGFVVLSGLMLGLQAVLKRMSTSFVDMLKFVGFSATFMAMATSVLILSVAIRMLVSSVSKLAELDWSGIAKGIVGIAAISAIMVGVAKLMSSSGSFLRAAASLIIIAVALKLLVKSLQLIGSMSMSQLGTGLLGIAASLAILVGGLAALSMLKGSLIRSAASLILFGMALKTFADVIRDFATIEFSSMIKASAALVTLAAGLAILSLTMSKMKFKTALTSVMELGAYSAFIKSIADAMTAFDGINASGIVKGVVAITAVMGALTIFVNKLGDSSRLILSKSAGLVAMAAAITIIADAFTKFNSIGIDGVAKGLVSLAGGLAAMVIALKKMPSEALFDKSASLIIVATGISILADALKTLGSMSVSELAKGLGAFAASLVIMGVALNKINPATCAQAGGALALVGLGMAMLVGPLQILGTMNLADMVQGLAGFAAALAIVNFAAKKMGSMGMQMVKAAGGIAVFSGAMVLFGIGLSAIVYPITQLGQLSGGQLTGAMAALVGIVGIVTALSQLMKAMPAFSVSAIAKLAVITVAIGLIGAIIGNLASIDSRAALESATAMSEVILAASAALLVLGNIPMSGVLKGVVALAAIIAGISAVVMAMGGIAQIPGVRWLVNEGKNFLQSIGEAIGAFFGGIAGGAIDAASTSLPALGRRLSSFAENAQPFFDTMRGIDTGVTEGVRNLAQAFLMLSAGNVLDTVVGFYTGKSSLTKFGQELAQFAPYFKQYANSIAGVDADAVKNSAVAAQALVELANNLPKSGGLAQLIMGEGSLSNFAKELVPFAESMKQYSDAIAGIDNSAVENSATAAKALSELANEIPKYDGLMQLFTGTSSLDDFGETLIPFGESLKGYADSVSGIDSSAIESSASAAKALAEVANALDESGGVVGWFMGDKDFGGFAENVSSLGEGLKAYYEAVGGEDFAGIENSLQAVKTLAEISNSLGTAGSVFDVFTGTSSEAMESFARCLPLLGFGIGGFAKSLENVSDFSNVEAAASATKTLTEISNSLGSSGGIFDAFTGTNANAMASFADGLSNLGRGISGFASEVSDTSFDNVEPSANAIKTLSEVAGNLGTSGGIFDAFTGTSARSMSSFATGLQNLGSGISKYASEVSGVEFSNVETSAQALNSLSSIAGNLGAEGGIAQFFAGGNAQAMSSFADNLSSLGAGIGAYAENVSGKDFGNVETSAQALQSLSTIQNGMDAEGGFFGLFTGSASNSLSSFAANLGSLGTGIATYADNVSGHDFSAVEGSVAAIQQVANVVQSMNDVNTEGITKFSDTITNIGDMGLNTFNEALKDSATSVAENMSSLSEAITSGTGEISTAIDTMKSNLEAAAVDYENVGNNIGTGLAEGISSGVSTNEFQIIDALQNALNRAQSDGESKADEFKSVGERLVEAINNGIHSKEHTISSAVQSALNAVSVDTSRFTRIGEQAGAGIVQGLENKRGAIMSKAQSIADSAANSISSALQVHSPSRITTRIGEYVGIGLANGLSNMTGRVEDSAREMAMSALDTTAAIVAMINDEVDQRVEMAPKITPVLDLSNISGTTLTLNNPDLGLATESLRMYAGQINTRSRFMENQNGTQLLISNLNDKFDELSEKIEGIDINPTLEMYVDSKKLASSIAKPMNRQLGSISKSRGIT